MEMEMEMEMGYVGTNKFGQEPETYTRIMISLMG
jgi:hypothetical protein